MRREGGSPAPGTEKSQWSHEWNGRSILAPFSPSDFVRPPEDGIPARPVPKLEKVVRPEACVAPLDVVVHVIVVVFPDSSAQRGIGQCRPLELDVLAVGQRVNGPAGYPVT